MGGCRLWSVPSHPSKNSFFPDPQCLESMDLFLLHQTLSCCLWVPCWGLVTHLWGRAQPLNLGKTYH